MPSAASSTSQTVGSASTERRLQRSPVGSGMARLTNSVASSADVEITHIENRCSKNTVPKTPNQKATLKTLAESAMTLSRNTRASALVMGGGVMGDGSDRDGVAMARLLGRRVLGING